MPTGQPSVVAVKAVVVHPLEPGPGVPGELRPVAGEPSRPRSHRVDDSHSDTILGVTNVSERVQFRSFQRRRTSPQTSTRERIDTHVSTAADAGRHSSDVRHLHFKGATCRLRFPLSSALMTPYVHLPPSSRPQPSEDQPDRQTHIVFSVEFNWSIKGVASRERGLDTAGLPPILFVGGNGGCARR